MGNILRTDPRQQRADPRCNAILAAVARARAQDMVARDYFGHTNPDGYGPNYLVRQAGYVLPSFYSTALDANNIESIAAGTWFDDAQVTWDQWLLSAPHRRHLLGEIEFYAAQYEYGVGYAQGGYYGHYWVVITAWPGP